MKRQTNWLTILALVFYAYSGCFCMAIRWGFLADAFARRNVSGKVYGLMGSSVFAGFLFMFVFQIAEKFMMRWNSRTIMIISMLGWAISALITGFAYRISNTTAVIIISFVMRIIQGIFAYASLLVPVDFINANFPEKFDMLNGLIQVGYFSGNGMGEFLGCILYEKFGYETAYACSSLIAFVATASAYYFLPNTKTYLSIRGNISEDNQKIKEVGFKKMKLAMFLIGPMAATMVINANYGVVQVAVTPYLKEEFHKSISYGGSVLTLVSVGAIIGSLCVGLILQNKVVNHFNVMGIGALCVFTGLMLTFPPESIPALHNIAPITAFPGVFIAGIGDPVMTIATLRALFDVQTKKKGVPTPRIVTKITGMWIVGSCAMYQSGALIAGTLTDYLSYTTTAQIQACVSLLAMFLCLMMRLYFKDKEGGDEDENEALIR